jgi:hypothetical protein
VIATVGPKMDEVTGDGERGRLHNVALHDTNSSPNITRVIKRKTKIFVGACGMYGGKRSYVQRFGEET